MKDVAADQHDVWRNLDHFIESTRERQCHVRFALIDPTRSLPLILAVAEMEVGEMDEAQG
jgi:hypothetical protein